MTPDEFFAGKQASRLLFERVERAVGRLGKASIHASKSQVAFRWRRNFAWVWVPGMYLRGKTAPLVLTVALPARDGSSRWKEVVEPAPGRFIHHLELYEPGDIDEEAEAWLREAWDAA
jgi:hypothetical protein